MSCRFARDAETLSKVGHALLAGSAASTAPLEKWLVGKDAFAMAEEAAGAIYSRLSGNFAAVQGLLGEPAEVSVSEVRPPVCLLSLACGGPALTRRPRSLGVCLPLWCGAM